MQFSAWFKKQDGLTQQAFADRLGVTQGRVSQLLDDELPSMALAGRIQKETNGAVTPNDWLRKPTAAPASQSEAIAS